MDKITGTVTEIIFSNENNGYTVCALADGEEEYTAVGCMPFIEVGCKLSLEGEWVQHLEFGEQFKVSSFAHCPLSTDEDIYAYLASGAIKGIKAATAKKIIDAFGSNTLNIIQNEPDKLCRIKGISVDKANIIHNQYIKQISIRSLISFFTQYGVTVNFAYKVFKQFGEKAIVLVKENPYILCEIEGIGFNTADRIASLMDFTKDSPLRVDAAIIFCLSQNAANGHTYMPLRLLCSQTAELLYMPSDFIETEIAKLLIETKLRRRSGKDDEHIYLPAFYVAEEGCGSFLKHFSLTKPKLIPEDITGKLLKFEKDNFALADMQKRAVEYAMNNSCTVITGGPGTGKTTIINTIIHILSSENCNISLCAPTGRAAKRMSQMCGLEAKTIHRLLEVEYSYDKSRLIFNRNSNNPLDTDVLIVDEMSMVDIILFYNLIKAIPDHCRLILVGDCDQLPPVGAGNVLKDIIDSEIIETVRLTEIFRQARESLIVTNAHKINSGEFPLFDNGKNSDFFYISRDVPSLGIKEITELCHSRLPRYLNKNSLDAVQVLTPTKRGPFGTESLNKTLQEIFNPPHKSKPELARRTGILRKGDKVMQTRNNYDIEWYGDKTGAGIFNGDMGIIEDIDTNRGILKIVFDGDKITDYPIELTIDIELAYAITVHKSQGSEFDGVILPMYPCHKNLMSRNLFYTAVTRAKALVVLVGRADVISYMVSNDYRAERYSGLKDILISEGGDIANEYN